MIWTERALRSISGQYFSFKSSEKFSKELAEFRDQSDKLGFVMEWMSRGRVYVAPREVQEKVINAWKVWFKNTGGDFTIKKFEEFGEWYW